MEQLSPEIIEGLLCLHQLLEAMPQPPSADISGIGELLQTGDTAQALGTLERLMGLLEGPNAARRAEQLAGDASILRGLSARISSGDGAAAAAAARALYALARHHAAASVIAWSECALPAAFRAMLAAAPPSAAALLPAAAAGGAQARFGGRAAEVARACTGTVLRVFSSHSAELGVACAVKYERSVLPWGVLAQLHSPDAATARMAAEAGWYVAHCETGEGLPRLLRSGPLALSAAKAIIKRGQAMGMAASSELNGASMVCLGAWMLCAGADLGLDCGSGSSSSGGSGSRSGSGSSGSNGGPPPNPSAPWVAAMREHGGAVRAALEELQRRPELASSVMGLAPDIVCEAWPRLLAAAGSDGGAAGSDSSANIGGGGGPESARAASSEGLAAARCARQEAHASAHARTKERVASLAARLAGGDAADADTAARAIIRLVDDAAAARAIVADEAKHGVLRAAARLMLLTAPPSAARLLPAGILGDGGGAQVGSRHNPAAAGQDNATIALTRALLQVGEVEAAFNVPLLPAAALAQMHSGHEATALAAAQLVHFLLTHDWTFNSNDGALSLMAHAALARSAVMAALDRVASSSTPLGRRPPPSALGCSPAAAAVKAAEMLVVGGVLDHVRGGGGFLDFDRSPWLLPLRRRCGDLRAALGAMAASGVNVSYAHPTLMYLVNMTIVGVSNEEQKQLVKDQWRLILSQQNVRKQHLPPPPPPPQQLRQPPPPQQREGRRPPRSCSVCGRTKADGAESLRRCRGCGLVTGVRYCSVECARVDWKTRGHRAVCKEAQPRQREVLEERGERGHFAL